MINNGLQQTFSQEFYVYRPIKLLGLVCFRRNFKLIIFLPKRYEADLAKNVEKVTLLLRKSEFFCLWGFRGSSWMGEKILGVGRIKHLELNTARAYQFNTQLVSPWNSYRNAGCCICHVCFDVCWNYVCIYGLKQNFQYAFTAECQITFSSVKWLHDLVAKKLEISLLWFPDHKNITSHEATNQYWEASEINWFHTNRHQSVNDVGIHLYKQQ